MQLLYIAYACEKIEEDGKTLLPGYPATPGMKNLKPGDRIQVELADGTRLKTVVVKTQIASFAESVVVSQIGAGSWRENCSKYRNDEEFSIE